MLSTGESLTKVEAMRQFKIIFDAHKYNFLWISQDWQIDAHLSSDQEIDEDEDMDISIKDLEFRVMHDLSQVQNQCNSSRSFTLKEINILKVIWEVKMPIN